MKNSKKNKTSNKEQLIQHSSKKHKISKSKSLLNNNLFLDFLNVCVTIFIIASIIHTIIYNIGMPDLETGKICKIAGFLAVISIPLTLKLLSRSFDKKYEKGQTISGIEYLLGPFIAFLLSTYFYYSIIVNTNCFLDFSSPRKEYTTIEDTQSAIYESGKSKNKYFFYSITFRHWKYKKESVSCNTNEAMYYRAKPGDVAVLEVKKGLWGFEYCTNIEGFKILPSKTIPPGAKFPMSEEEFQKIHIKSKADK